MIQFDTLNLLGHFPQPNVCVDLGPGHESPQQRLLTHVLAQVLGDLLPAWRRKSGAAARFCSTV